MSIEAMKQALEALERLVVGSTYEDAIATEKAITALRTAIEQAEKQEQCKEHGECFGGKCIYTTPPAAQQEAVLAEREACAKVCIEQSARWHTDQRDVYVAHECAAAIRARGQA